MKLALAGALLLALAVPAVAQEACVTIEEDKELAEQKGLEYLGVLALPFTSDVSVFYAYQGYTWVSPIVDGCVADTMYRAGEYVPQKQA